MTKKAATQLPKTSSEQVKINRDRIDDLVRKTLKAEFKQVCPVLGSLGSRHTMPSKKSGYPFERFLAQAPDKLVTVFVGGLHTGELTASISNAVKSTFTVRTLLARLERKTKRAAAKLANEKHAIEDTFKAPKAKKPTQLDKENEQLVAAAKKAGK